MVTRREAILAKGWGEDTRSSASVEVANEAYFSEKHTIFSRKVSAPAMLRQPVCTRDMTGPGA